MKLHRLKVSNFAAVQDIQVEFGPGLNVLYGPNDLGKSTLVSAIRLALLLPHASTACEDYVPWKGAGDPTVDLTFETEPQRIWRVKKVFGKSGSSLLQESKNGRDFDTAARARGVDSKLREILRWGIPEPGGSGAARGVPRSFLATALISTQADVAAMLHESLQADTGSSSGKERIAAALQAVAQDPLFVDLLRCTQAQRDKAYTDKGARRTGKGSIFKDASERLNAARDEKERLKKIVTDSQSAEKSLQDLTTRRAEKQESLAAAADELAALERFALQAANRAAAEDQVCLTQQEVARIQKIGAEVEAAEVTVARLIQTIEEAKQALEAAQSREAKAREELDRAEETARGQDADSSLNTTVLRQQLELRKVAADQAFSAAQQRIQAVEAAQKLVEAAAAAERASLEQQAKTERVRALSSQAAAKEAAVSAELQRCELLGHALELRAAAAVQERMDRLTRERAATASARGAFTVPAQAELARLRRLANDLNASQRALEVGLVVTVTPNKPLDLSVRKDGAATTSTSIDHALDIEAAGEVEVSIGDVATVRVRGGRRQAQEDARILEDRWKQEAVPHLNRAGVADIDELEAKLGEARDLDATLAKQDAELGALRSQIASMTAPADAGRAALENAGTSPALKADLKKLGADPVATLRKRRQQAAEEIGAVRKAASSAASDVLLAEERAKNLETAWRDAESARNAALTDFRQPLDSALSEAQTALAAANAEKKKVAAEVGSLERTSEERKRRIDAAMADARRKADEAMKAARAAQDLLTKARTDHASESALLGAKRKDRDAEDLPAAQAKLDDALKKRTVTTVEVDAARATVASIKSALQLISADIQRAQGALGHVGGAVARERLRDAIEAFELAERLEKETEAEYEAWKLLLEQMKEADAAQASNLGQALAPAIAGHFQTLTRKRYDNVRLTPHLGTEGVLVAGAVRDADRMSVGTREQLSTLYRLCLAEYLQTMIVLDDQLVQSDETRMDWFRALLTDKARTFQIIVFTCRPADYLAVTSMVPEGIVVHADSDDGFVRAIDLGRNSQIL
jgi:energy-coupling factor transporter ATP-binding protein EcfA2